MFGSIKESVRLAQVDFDSCGVVDMLMKEYELEEVKFILQFINKQIENKIETGVDVMNIDFATD